MDSCPVRRFCANDGDRCFDCCASLPLVEAVESELPLLYRRLSPTDPDHPVTTARRNLAVVKKDRERSRRKSEAFKSKSRMVRKAFRNEAGTRKDIIRATQRSGAVNGDGDSRFGDGQWGIDDKLMSRASAQFTVTVAEISKASAQKCIIVVTLNTGRKFVVAELEDFCSASEAMAAACRKEVQ